MQPQLVKDSVDSHLFSIIDIEESSKHFLEDFHQVPNTVHKNLEDSDFILRSEFYLFAFPMVSFNILLLIALSLTIFLVCLSRRRAKTRNDLLKKLRKDLENPPSSPQ